MSAGAGTKAYEDALKLERLLVASFGPDFREKVLRLPYGSWPLRDAFEECGLPDPRSPAPSSQAVGLWQMPPIPLPLSPLSPEQQAGWAARYIAERYPMHEGLRALRVERYRRFASPSAVADRMGIERPWPSSPTPRSPHGDPLR